MTRERILYYERFQKTTRYIIDTNCRPGRFGFAFVRGAASDRARRGGFGAHGTGGGTRAEKRRGYDSLDFDRGSESAVHTRPGG